MMRWITIGLPFTVLAVTAARWLVGRRIAAMDLRVDVGLISDAWLAQHNGMRRDGWEQS
jgi:hypothetical protein